MTRNTRWLTVLALALGVWASAWAGPFINKPKVAMRDEMQGLANLRRVGLFINPLPRLLTGTDVTRDRLRTDIVKTLAGGGIEVLERETRPMLVLSVLTTHDRRDPDIHTVIIFVDIQQRVRIHRLEKDLSVPTATVITFDIGRRSGIAELVEELVRDATTQFMMMEAAATKYHQNTR